MTMQRHFFPQDEIWNNASDVELRLMKADGRWFLTFKVSGTIGRDPFEDDDDDEDDGGLAEPKAEDPAGVASSIIADLLKRGEKKRT